MESHQLDNENCNQSETNSDNNNRNQSETNSDNESQTSKLSTNKESVEFLSNLIKMHEAMIEQHKTTIVSIVNQINIFEKGKHVSEFLSYLDLSFETEKISDAFNDWCYDNISIDNITLKCGYYLAKRGIYVNVYTCGYLEQRLLYHCNEHFSEYADISGNRPHEINPESLYPKKIQTKDQLCDYFTSLYKANSQDHDVDVDDMLDFMIVYWFTEMFNEGLYYTWELSVKENFSKYDY